MDECEARVCTFISLADLVWPGLEKHSISIQKYGKHNLLIFIYCNNFPDLFFPQKENFFFFSFAKPFHHNLSPYLFPFAITAYKGKGQMKLNKTDSPASPFM